MTALSIRYGPAPTLPLDVLLSMIPSLPRAALDRLTEQMIDRMDQLDGDPDREPDDEAGCDAGDDGCGPIRTWRGIVWGYEMEYE